MTFLHTFLFYEQLNTINLIHGESSKFLSDIMSAVSSVLYQDFTERLADHIKHGQAFYTTKDYLVIAREIFKEYHAECNLHLPKWFSEQRFDDYNERCKKIWRELLTIALPEKSVGAICCLSSFFLRFHTNLHHLL